MELCKGGAGKKGGVSEYARQIGRGEKQIREWIKAGEVGKNFGNISEVFDRTYHLAAIHAAPQELWPVFVEGPIGPSVSQSDAPIGASVSQSDAGRAVSANWREQAKQRRLATLKRGEEIPVQANWPERESGQARDHVANLFGVSPRAVERAETVYRDRRKTAGRPKEGDKLTQDCVNLSDNHHERASSAATAAVVGTSARKVECAGGLARDSLDNSRRV